MKQVLFIIILSIVLLTLLNESGILNALLGFLLAGAIPGTSYSIPSTFMLLILVSGIWVILFRLTAIEWLQAYIRKSPRPRSSRTKKQLPRRRYGQV